MYSDELYNEKTPNTVVNPSVEYDELSQDYIADSTAKYERVKAYGHFDVYKQIYVNLDPFINISVAKVDGDFSLHRTYQLFRTLGLRHLVVVDIRNQPIGMITRQDLMAFNIQDKLESLPTDNPVLDALMNESISSDDTSEDTKSDTILPAITMVPSISSKIVETIHEENEEDLDDDVVIVSSSSPRSSSRQNSERSQKSGRSQNDGRSQSSGRSQNDEQSQNSSRSQNSVPSKISGQTQATVVSAESKSDINHGGWGNHDIYNNVDTTVL